MENYEKLLYSKSKNCNRKEQERFVFNFLFYKIKLKEKVITLVKFYNNFRVGVHTIRGLKLSCIGVSNCFAPGKINIERHG